MVVFSHSLLANSYYNLGNVCTIVITSFPASLYEDLHSRVLWLDFLLERGKMIRGSGTRYVRPSARINRRVG